MVSASSTPVLQPVSEKLSKNNNSLWKAQVRAAIRGARLLGFITGENKAPVVEIVGADSMEEKKSNPALEDWEAMD
jgi:hypothetical protein